MRSIQRWRKGISVSCRAADEVLIALDLMLWEIPEHLWIEGRAAQA
jgi:hypothetical protein